MQLTKGAKLRLTVFLGALTALAPLATDMYLPSLPIMTDAFGASASLIQLTLTMTMAGMAIGQVLGGPISDMRGRRMPLIFGMAAFAASAAVCVLAQDIYVFLLFRFLQGLTGAFGIVIARAIARDLCEGPALTQFFSMLMLVNGLAPIIAPVVGGQILLIASWRGVFVLLAVIGALLVLGSLRFEESLPQGKRAAGLGSSFHNFKILLGDRYFLGHCLLQCFFFAAFFAYISGSSFLFQNVYRVSAQVYSFIFGGLGFCIVVTGVIPARLAGRVSDVTFLSWSLGESAVGALLFLSCIMLHVPLLATLAALLVIVPMVSILGASSFSLAMRSHGQRAGSAAALLGFFQMLAGAAVAPLVGVNGPNDALPMAVAMLAGTLLAGLAFLAMVRPAHC